MLDLGKRKSYFLNKVSQQSGNLKEQHSPKLHGEEMKLKLEGEAASVHWLPSQKSASIKTCAEAQLCGDL